MCPFSVTVDHVRDRELGPLLVQLGRAGFHDPIIRPAGSSEKARPPAVTLWAGEDVVNAQGNHLTIGNVIVTSDRLTIQYRATGTSFDAEGLSPAGQPPTQLSVTVDGKALTPLEGNVGGDPQNPFVTGDFSWRWSGGTPRHIHLVVTRILGDPNANWVADFDLQAPASK